MAKSKKELQLNNDAEEKVNRRKSAALEKRRQSLMFGGPLLPASADQSQTTLAVVEDSSNNAPVPPLLNTEKLSVEEISRRYDEWMKIAADNKINTNNSWNVQLIDYFHELSLMREGDSINFQKASCTLDGCVKVYTTRVDAVATETNRLLSGLSDKNSDSKKSDTDDENSGEEDDDMISQQAKVKKKSRSGTTIEKKPLALNVKKFDLEFSVDPLFKKTCADFDEGGAGGLLLNHLSMFGNGRIVFDASDVDATKSMMAGMTEEEELEANEMIDISELISKFGDDLRDIKQKTVCPSLTSFKFSDKASNITSSYSTLKNSSMMEMDDENSGDNSFSSSNQENIVDNENELDEIEYEERLEEDEDVEMFNMPDYDQPADFGYEEYENDANEIVHEPAYETELIQEIAAENNQRVTRRQVQFELTNDDLYSYIDTSTMKNWAPPHWKVYRPVKKIEVSALQKKAKKEKQVFKIDFTTPVNQKELFTKDTKGTTLMSKNKMNSLEGNLLPMDIHYSLSDLTQLFLKPKLRSTMKGRRVLVSNDTIGHDTDLPEDYLNADNDMHDDYEDGLEEYYDNVVEYSNDEPVLSSTQESDIPFSQEDFNTNIIRVKPEAISYSKKAKKVDIKQLKEKIWTDIEDETQSSHNNCNFTSIVDHVQSKYPQDKAKDITVSFYFICLLHLANEKNLRIEGTQSMNELRIIRNQI